MTIEACRLEDAKSACGHREEDVFAIVCFSEVHNIVADRCRQYLRISRSSLWYAVDGDAGSLGDDDEPSHVQPQYGRYGNTSSWYSQCGFDRVIDDGVVQVH